MDQQRNINTLQLVPDDQATTSGEDETVPY